MTRVKIQTLLRSLGAEGPRPVPLSYSTKIALLTGSVYVASLVLLHVVIVVYDLSSADRWLGRSVIEWLTLAQILLVILTAAASVHLLQRHSGVEGGHASSSDGAPGRMAGRAPVGDEAEAPVLLLESALADKNQQIADANRHLSDLVKELSLLYEIGQGINATIELEELFEVITQMLKRHLHLHEFAILLMEDDQEILRVRAAYGFPNPDRVHDLVFRVGEGVSGEVARSGRLVYVRDTRRDGRYLHYRGELREEGSFLSIPLRYKKEVLGVINFSRRGVQSFSKGEVRFLTLVANQVGLAIANAKLYTRTRELSVRDDLTGLYNRRYFQQTLQVEWKRAVRFRRQLSVLIIDVDRFKSYNDTFGHLQGDQVLKQIAALLQRHLREVDTVARFGGEEFVVLLPDTDRQGAMAVGEKLRHLVELERFPTPTAVGESLPLTISIGVAVYPDDVHEIEDLIDHADIALYEAKDTGRNRVIGYTPIETTQEEIASHH